MTDPKLKSLAERIERLMDERDGIQSDIRDIYTEAKSHGYVPKVLRKAITRKRMDPSKRDEEDSILELYESALDAPTRKAMAMARSGATSREIAQATGISRSAVSRDVPLVGQEITEVPPVATHTEREEPNAGLSSSTVSDDLAIPMFLRRNELLLSKTTKDPDEREGKAT